jgi:hypothetical protein
MIHEWWALLSQLGLWGWIFSVVFFIFSAFTRQGEFNTRSYKWGVVSVCSFAFWIVGMTLA